MSEASFASLSPTLLARKGGAKPAMRPQLASLGQISGQAAAENLEDLGWDDMGEDDAPCEAKVVHLTPAPHHDEADEETREQDLATASLLVEKAEPAVRKQQVELAERIAAPRAAAPAKSAKPKTRRKRRSALDRGDRAAFTLRLDAQRHLKLRLACAVRNRSAQQLVTDALDTLLERMPEIESLASQVKRT